MTIDQRATLNRVPTDAEIRQRLDMPLEKRIDAQISDLNKRMGRNGDRRQESVPVAVERRSGQDRRSR
jgi:hypothetical protein